MIKIYNTDIETNNFKEINEYKTGSWIDMINPTEEEIKTVCSKLNIQEDFLYNFDKLNLLIRKADIVIPI